MERGVFRGQLDDEQRIVFAQVLKGRTGREIATDLRLEPARVERIVRKTCRQLGADGRQHAAWIIASHGDGLPQAHNTAAGRTAAAINHNGAEFRGVSAKTVQTESDRLIDNGYVRDVGSNRPSQVDIANILGELAGVFSSQKSSDAFPYVQRIFLITIVILCSTMALSALVSTLQGFDKLIGS